MLRRRRLKEEVAPPNSTVSEEETPRQSTESAAQPLTEQQQIDLVKKSYKQIGFSASYAGIVALQRALKLEKGQYISQKTISKALNEIPSYVMHLGPIKAGPRAHYAVTSLWQVVQGDLAFLFPYKGYNSFLLVIDVFSRRIFTRPLRTKTGPEVLKQLDSIIKEGKMEIQVFQTDRGKEFTSIKKELEKRDIKFTVKVGQNKANFAESGIGRVKKRLYQYLQSQGSQDWPSALPKITKNINNTPMKALGFFCPNQVQSVLDEPELKAAQAAQAEKMNPKQRDRYFPQLTTYSMMQKNAQKYDKKPQSILVGDFVYKTQVPKTMSSSSDIKRGEVFIILEILKNRDPVRYRLLNLRKEEIPGTYYRWNLVLVPEIAKPTNLTSFRVEYIVDEKKQDGVAWVKVKWQNYDHSFDSWIPKKNITKSAVTDK